MAEKQQIQSKPYSIVCENNLLTIKGVKQVVEISEKEAVLKLYENTLIVKGDGLNVIKLDKEQGVVVSEYKALSLLSFKQNGFSVKGLFR